MKSIARVVHNVSSDAVVVYDNLFRPKNGGKLCKGHSAEFKHCQTAVSISAVGPLMLF